MGELVSYFSDTDCTSTLQALFLFIDEEKARRIYD